MVTAMATKPELMPGTLDMLILKTLTRAPLHGYGIAQSIKRVSDAVLTVEEGSLYPALQRMLKEGWVDAKWGLSASRRRIRIYRLTPAGAKHLEREVSSFERMLEGIRRVLSPVEP
jgi:PadR family transcriptional regulator, regulatory protein PadR